MLTGVALPLPDLGKLCAVKDERKKKPDVGELLEEFQHIGLLL